MGDNLNLIKKNILFVVAALTLLTYIVLFYLRSFDDSRLTSWDSAFNFVDPGNILLVLIAGLILVSIILKTSFPGKHPLLYLFVSSYAFAALFWGEPEVLVDASRYFTQAKHLEIYGIGYFFREWGKDITAWTDMPLVPFLYGLIFKYAGEHRIYIQAFTTLLFSMSVVLTCLTGKILWDEQTGLLGGTLLLGIPYLFSQVPLMLVDVPAMFFLLLAIYTFILALERGGFVIGIASLAIALACYVKYSAWLMLTVLPVIYLVYMWVKPKQERSLVFYRGAFIFFVAGLLAAIFIVYKYDVISGQMRLLTDYQRPGLRRWGESFISTFLFQVHPFMTAAAVYSAYRALRKRDLHYLVILWLVFLVIVLQIRRIRYIIMVFPMFSLMASYGLMQIRDSKTIKYISLCILTFSITIAVFAYLPFLNRISSVNLKDAGAFLDTIGGKDVEVFSLSPQIPAVNPPVSVAVFDLFTQKKIHYDYRETARPSPEEILTSSLRFTWEYRNPGYYADKVLNERYAAAAVISGSRAAVLPLSVALSIKRFNKARVFNITEDLFEYQTFVTIYYD